ncbi:MAG: hypothetical protein A2664_03825 [Candidatus Taylorbacteria bacterium RIFCSPHIGHO2_01_FULL_46_22b]|uniref:UDP-glucose/GDP-mannose dehydrogenase dimerisation domain-containing protein n=1 Tax=Candidatus Taylorbacteria bacterium RIFCSPHIGHO2_01_FULL_46_22b TaxID=1802301 RepID=A0A1G2M1F9_9BACT|nr:MAG: hypothetical protein A2664_03825 [Candidatus Taylorbacteria bacterium RIFCSPHIGHO2_01_FULL_46_22b]
MDVRTLFMKKQNLTIGFIGQGWVGRHYADAFEQSGFITVRYGLEPQYVGNKSKIKDCDITFIAVPTPTTPKGFSLDVVKEGLKLIGKGKIAVIKSTIVPGSTARLQKAFPNKKVLYSPEFLSESTAAYDVAHPFANIVGLPVDNADYRAAAKKVHSILLPSPFSLTCTSTEAEVIKYSHNASGYVQIIFFNVMYDLAKKLGADWTPIQQALRADPLISNRYAQPVHKSGRGAGGSCFIKDVAALRTIYEKLLPKDKKSSAFLRALESKNIELLTSTKKDLHLLKGVYGEKLSDPAVKSPKTKK